MTQKPSIKKVSELSKKIQKILHGHKSSECLSALMTSILDIVDQTFNVSLTTETEKEDFCEELKEVFSESLDKLKLGGF